MKKLTALFFTVFCLSLFVISPRAGAEEEAWLYTTIKNDSFERIYQKYLSKRQDIAALAALNHHPLKKKLALGQVVTIPVRMLKRVPATSQVILATGDVTTVDGASGAKRALKQEDILNAGDEIYTGKNSLAKLRLADGSVASIQPLSQMRIQTSFQYKGKETFVTQLKLMQGRTELVANPNHVVGNSLQVETPSAIAAVRGTVFRVGATSDVALQETLQGQVAFSAAGQQMVLAQGFGTIAEKGQAPLPPIALPDTPDVKGWATLVEHYPVAFPLKAQAGVAAWVSQIALDSEFSRIVGEQVQQALAAEQLPLADLPDGRYYLKLRAQDSHGLQGLEAVHAFEVRIAPPPPVVVVPAFELVQPEADVNIDLAPNHYSWVALAEADAYLIQFSRTPDFKVNVFEFTSQTNALETRNSFGSGAFYWRVIALAQGKPIQTTAPRRFVRE